MRTRRVSAWAVSSSVIPPKSLRAWSIRIRRIAIEATARKCAETGSRSAQSGARNHASGGSPFSAQAMARSGTRSSCLSAVATSSTFRYTMAVPRSLIFRSTAALIACAASLAGPSAALGHGYQHTLEQQVTGHHEEHHRPAGHGVTLEVADHGDHSHLRVESASASRIQLPVLPGPAQPAEVDAPPPTARFIVVSSDTNLPGCQQATGPPLHSRAPPLI